MAAVQQGATLMTDNDVLVRATPSGPLVDPDSGTLILTIKRPDGTTLLTVPQSGLTRISQGHFSYDWAVAADLPVGDYPWNWNGAVAGVQLPTAVNEIVVVLAGQLSTGALLDVDELREHVTTPAPDTALQRFLDAGQSAIEGRYGPSSGNVTEILDGGTRLLTLVRPLGSIVSVKETIWTTVTTLTTTDWQRRGDRYLERLETGGHASPVWQGYVEVVYTPADELAERIRMLISLVKIDLAFSGLADQSLGDYSETQLASYERAREDVLASYAGRAVFA